jgi:hypothetical protein
MWQYEIFSHSDQYCTTIKLIFFFFFYCISYNVTFDYYEILVLMDYLLKKTILCKTSLYIIAILIIISVISWRLVLLVDETGVSGENHRPAASHWQTLSHNVVSSTPRLSGIWTHNVIDDSITWPLTFSSYKKMLKNISGWWKYFH